MTPRESDEEIYGLDIVVADLCRCGCPLLRVHPYSVKSEIPIWKCVWCRKRRGRPTETELALMKAWLREYGHTLEPLCFPDTGGIEFAYSISGRGRGPVARINEDRTPDRAA
jgi:hypothetical protein